MKGFDSKEVDIYTTLGVVAELLAASEYHQQFRLKTYYYSQILPVINAQQMRIYFFDKNTAMAFVTWAWLSNEVLEVVGYERSIRKTEWNDGTNLLFNDFIAPHGNARKVFRDLINNVFPNHNSAHSLRREMDGTVRKKNLWQR